MARTSPPPSDEAQGLDTCLPRIVVEDTEPRTQSFNGPTPPWSPPASATYYSETSEGRDADPAHPPPDSQHQKQYWIRNQNPELPDQSDDIVKRLWLWELLSIAVATLALDAIMITLFLRRDRPLPDWPSAITINALISVFTAIFKACLMMPIAEGIGQLKWLWYQKSRPLRYMEQWDLASRGRLPRPWGCLLLISVLSCRNPAAIGAILTILVMAVDPFTQQVVQPYSCSREIEGERATVPISNSFTSSYPTAYQRAQLDPQTQLAIYAGLLEPPKNTSTALKFECMTGNCTFPSTDDGANFQTLALESRCTDNGSDIVFSIGNTEFLSLYDLNPHTAINATLPGYSLQLNNYSDLAMQSGSRPPTDWPSPFLTQVAFVMMSSTIDGGHRGEPQNTHAFECEFYPAVNTYNANITNGVLLERVLDSQRLDVWPSLENFRAVFTVNRTIREGKWHECTGNPNSSEEHNLQLNNRFFPSVGQVVTTYFSQVDAMRNDASNITWWPEDCVYSLPIEAANSLSEATSSILGNEIVLCGRGCTQPEGTPWSINLWNNGTPTLDTVQATMDGMARSVTARLRQGDGSNINTRPASGTVWGIQTCVRVNWLWLALPAGLLLLTIVFLILTIVKTRARQAQIWKSSILAVLFSGIDQRTRQADGSVASLEEMKAAADRATVRLENTEEGLRLVGQV